MPRKPAVDLPLHAVAAVLREAIGSSVRTGAMQQGKHHARRFIQRTLATLPGAFARLWPAHTRPTQRLVALVTVIAVLLLAAYSGVAATLYFRQRALMYFPETVHTAPAAAGFADASELTLTTSDGERIVAWYVPPTGDKPLILYFHGNGGALRYRVERFKKLVGDGIGLLGIDYRGYAGSTGSPSEHGLIADGEAAYEFAAAHYPVKQIVLWGESLGTGVAVALAAEKPVGRVILEAPFTSAAAVGAQRYWYLPVALLMRDQFHSDQRIGKVTAPLLILHGAKDQVVPYAMGERMFELANQPKHIVRFLDGGHEDLDQNGALIAIGRFLAGDLDSGGQKTEDGGQIRK
jgi:hypothetical protein